MKRIIKTNSKRNINEFLGHKPTLWYDFFGLDFKIVRFDIAAQKYLPMGYFSSETIAFGHEKVIKETKYQSWAFFLSYSESPLNAKSHPRLRS